MPLVQPGQGGNVGTAITEFGIETSNCLGSVVGSHNGAVVSASNRVLDNHPFPGLDVPLVEITDLGPRRFDSRNHGVGRRLNIDPQCLVRLDEIINCFHGVRFIRLFAIWQPDRDELVVLVRCFLPQLFHGQLT